MCIIIMVMTMIIIIKSHKAHTYITSFLAKKNTMQGLMPSYRYKELE